MDGIEIRGSSIEYRGDPPLFGVCYFTRGMGETERGFLEIRPRSFDKGATANSGVAVAYNVFIKIRKAWVDPDFDYGRCFNYKETKWTSLLNNYIDFNKLDLLRSKLRILKTNIIRITMLRICLTIIMIMVNNV